MNTLTLLKSYLDRAKKDLQGGLASLQWKREEFCDYSKNPFIKKAHPHSCEIFNLLNPLYLSTVKEFGTFARCDYILVRDGFFSLLDFFYRFARPGGCQTILLVHEKLKFIVPKTWADQVLTYNIQRKTKDSGRRASPKALYLLASSCDSDVRIKTFRHKMAEIKRVYGENLKNIDIKIGLLLRDDPFYNKTKESVHKVYFLLKEVFDQIDLNHTFCTWSEIEKSGDLPYSCYYNMAEECLGHGFSYIDHFFLYNHCDPFDDRLDKGKPGEEIFEMSPGYDIHINRFDFKANDLWDEVFEVSPRLGVGGRILNSSFIPYSFELADRYMFNKKSGLKLSSSRKTFTSLPKEQREHQYIQ
ncbi:MAG: hypothetical protein OXB88_03430 [Bacteriovoracales bacterium]|nr:hypothetical protein [Bacteriovoracales bacterium]